MPLTHDERRQQLREERHNAIRKFLKPAVACYMPEEILTVLGEELAKKADIPAEVEVANWVKRLAKRIDNRGD